MKRITLPVSYFCTLLFFVISCFSAKGQTTYTSQSDGDWNASSTWSPIGIPGNNDNVVINHAVFFSLAITRNSGTTTTISAGHSLTARATYTNNGTTSVYGTFQLDGGGYANGSNFFNYFSGSYLVFNNGSNYDINSGQRFWPSTSNAPDNVQINNRSSTTLNDASKTINNLILWGGFTNNQTLTVDGDLTINTNGFVGGNSPTYGTGSTLIYATGAIFGLGQEWRASSPPYNVKITNNTTLSYSTIQEERSINGNLTIDGGSQLDYGTASQMTGALIVKENATVSGTLTLGAFYGDDLKIGGNLIFNSAYNFNPHDRAVFFTKSSGTQSITTPSGASLTIPYVVIGTTSGTGTTLQLGQDLNISATGTGSGNALVFNNAGDVLDMNGHNLSIGNSSLTNTIAGPGAFKGSTTSDLTLVNQGSVGTIRFASGGQTLRNLILNCTSGQTAAVLGSNLTLTGSGTAFNGGLLDIGNYNLTFSPSAAYTIGGTGGNYILTASSNTGTVTKNFSSAGSFTYPIGDVSNYTPATINLNSVTGTPSVSMNVVNVRHPQNSASTNYLNRYWRVTSTGTFTGDATFTYVTGDVVGTESSLITAGWNGTPNNYWNLYNNANSVTHTLSATGLSDFNRDFTGGDKFTSAAVYFKSKQTGNWNSLTSWLMSTDNITWVDAVSIPDQNALGITIQNSHKITLTADASARKLRVDAGGILDNTNSAGGFLLTIFDDGTASSDFDIYGTYILYGTQPIFLTNAIATVYNGGIVRVDDNSGGGSSLFASTNSTNTTNSVYFNSGAIFDWNTSNAFKTNSNTIYFPNANASTIPYFVISKSVTVGAGTQTTINGLTIINANTTFQSGGNKIFRNGIAGNATLTQDGGIDDPGNFQISGNNATLGGAGLIINLTDILNIDTDVEVPLGSIVTINKQTGNKTSGKILKGAVVFTVNGTADMTTINMSNGSGSVVIKGYLKTAAPDGLKDISSGASPTFGGTTGGIVAVNANSTIEYNSMGNQKITSSGNLAGTAPYYNLVLSGGGTKTPVSAIYLDVNGLLKITGATTVVDASSNNIGPNNTTNSTSFTMDGGRLKLGTLGYTGSGTLPSMKGTYDLTGGVIEFLGGTASTSQSIRSGVDFNYYNIEVSGPYVSTSGGNVNIKDGGSFLIKNNGVFTINANSIKGVNTPSTAFVEVEGGGIFNSGNKGGFNGRAPAAIGDTTSSIHANITTITLDPNSTVAYTRSVPPLTDGDGSQPITTGSFTYQNLTLSGTGSKIAPFKANLPINGNFTVSGGAEFIHDSSTVTFINTADPQDISTVSATYPPVFYNLKNQNTQNLNINNFISVKNELTLDDNSKINLKDIIRLVSDADATASIAPIPEGTNAASIAYDTKGAFEVERFIPNHSKAWQLLSVPTKGSTIFNAWQNSGLSTPKRGVKITSPNWTSGDPRGFDGYSQGHSMKTYDPVEGNYVGVKNTGILIENPNGYFLFVRGDRSVAYGDPATEVTLQTTGKLYAPTPTGETPPDIIVPPNSFAMVGNPYASSIRYGQISRSIEIQSDYYIWDPQLTTGPYSNYGLGGFRTITANDATSNLSSGNYIDGDIPPIQSGQAFFVYNPSSSKNGTVSFSENAKVSGSRSIFREHKKVPAATASIQSGLEVIENDEPRVLDGTLQLFGKEYSNATDQYDAKKLMNSAENIMISASPYPLAIERRLIPEEKDTTFFILTGLDKRTYRLTLTVKGMQQDYLQPILNDKYLNSTQPLAEGENAIGFTVGNDNLSSDKNRFYITYKAIPKPFSFDNENAVTEDESIRIKWEGHNQENVKSYAIEQSMDTIQFNTIGDIPAVQGTDAPYSWTDNPEKEGVHYYRIRAFLNNGESIVSEIVSSAVAFKTPTLLLYPNPAIDHLRLRLTRKETGDYVVRIQQPDGKYVYSKIVHHNVHSSEYKISLPVLAAGIYNVEIISPAGLKEIKRVFIKK